ncbi:MAG TPA: ATP synthase subunit I [Polyangiaceae bacterium]|nr:ATP synthase subunit I [Polyangiaceae bacterium]
MIDESKAPEQTDDVTERDVAETGSAAPDAAAEGGTPPTLTFAIRAVGVAALVMTVTAALAFDLRAALGTLLGGILATANLWLFVRIAGAFLAQKGRAAPWVMLGGIKLLALFFCMFILIRRGDVSALALAAGYGALPIGITISTLFRKPEA